MKLKGKKKNVEPLIEIAYKLFDELEFEYGIVDPKGIQERREILDDACDLARGKSK